jgi:hypothetical protein
MHPEETEAAIRRLRETLDLYEAGCSMMRAKLRREHPGADEAELERLFRAWQAERPGAEHGDGVGRPRPLDLEGA